MWKTQNNIGLNTKGIDSLMQKKSGTRKILGFIGDPTSVTHTLSVGFHP